MSIQSIGLNRILSFAAAAGVTILAASQAISPLNAGENPRFAQRRLGAGGPPPSAAARAMGNAKAASEYDLYRIPLPSGFTGGVAYDINNRGTVVVAAFAQDGRDQTFLWNKGDQAPRLIRNPTAEITAFSSISDAGVLFGNWGSFLEQTAGFYHPATGQWRGLPPYPGKPQNYGYRANNSGFGLGLACGGTWFEPTDCVWWLWDGKEYKTPALPDGLWVLIDGVNEMGQIVGRRLLNPPFDFRSFILDGTKSTDLLPGVKSSAYDINNRGEVVLNYEAEPNTLFIPAVLSAKGELTNLPLFPGALGTAWGALNDRGDFAGLSYDAMTVFREVVYPIVALAKNK